MDPSLLKPNCLIEYGRKQGWGDAQIKFKSAKMLRWMYEMQTCSRKLCRDIGVLTQTMMEHSNAMVKALDAK